MFGASRPPERSRLSATPFPGGDWVLACAPRHDLPARPCGPPRPPDGGSVRNCASRWARCALPCLRSCAASPRPWRQNRDSKCVCLRTPHPPYARSSGPPTRKSWSVTPDRSRRFRRDKDVRLAHAAVIPPSRASRALCAWSKESRPDPAASQVSRVSAAGQCSVLLGGRVVERSAAAECPSLPVLGLPP